MHPSLSAHLHIGVRCSMLGKFSCDHHRLPTLLHDLLSRSVQDITLDCCCCLATGSLPCCFLPSCALPAPMGRFLLRWLGRYGHIDISFAVAAWRRACPRCWNSVESGK